MRTVISIEGVEEKRKGDSIYYKTFATLDDGEEAVGYGDEFEVGDLVERFYDSKWDVIKMRKTPPKE